MDPRRFGTKRTIESESRLPVEYDMFIAQLTACADTIDRLRAAEQTPKVEAMLERLLDAQQRMLEAMRALPTPYT